MFLMLTLYLGSGCAWNPGLSSTVFDPGKADRQRKHALQADVSAQQKHSLLKAAYALLESGDYDRCHRMLDEAQKVDSTDKDLALLRAEVFLAESRFTMAADVYQRLINQDPEDASLRQLKAVALELSGDAEGAKLAFQDAARLSPGDAVIQMSQIGQRNSDMR